MTNLTPNFYSIPYWRAKSAVGKALSSEVSFTLGNGIINEIYYPREDSTYLKNLELIVTAGNDFYSAEEKEADHKLEWIERMPAFSIESLCHQKRYKIEKEIISDSLRNSLLQQVKFKSFVEGDYHLFASLYLSREGFAYVEIYKGIKMLFGESQGKTVAFACSTGWKKCAVGDLFLRQELKSEKKINESQRVESEHVEMIGEINLENTEEVILVLGFGNNLYEAANNAYSSLLEGFASVKNRYIQQWKKWNEIFLKREKGLEKYFRESVTLLRLNESNKFPGAITASPSIPWENPKNSHTEGYQLVWPRDLVETAGALLSFGAHEECLRILNYLMSLQEHEGRWMQNYFIDGQEKWKKNQMDQVALPLILAGCCFKQQILKAADLRRYWPLLKKAVSFLIVNGPSTEQGRWEESQTGYSPYTIATEIVALQYAAYIAEHQNDHTLATYCLETADHWNEHIESWCYVTDTELSREVNVEGYYVRCNPKNVPICKNKDEKAEFGYFMGEVKHPQIGEIICVDALALVRYGLRAADDPRILNTIKVIDAKLKGDTPTGPSWHRFSYDWYGEHPDGSVYDGKGVGRLWPLLTGERAHYEIAAGNIEKAKSLMQTMESFAHHGLFSEQVWDTMDMPEKKLFLGKHTGSGMPLIWAHAEYIKLCLSLEKGKVVDMPEETRKRYIEDKMVSHLEIWRFDRQIQTVSKDKKLRIEIFKPTKIVWTVDAWQTKNEMETKDTGVNIYYADIPIQQGSTEIIFTFFWEGLEKWDDNHYKVQVT